MQEVKLLSTSMNLLNLQSCRQLRVLQLPRISPVSFQAFALLSVKASNSQEHLFLLGQRCGACQSAAGRRRLKRRRLCSQGNNLRFCVCGCNELPEASLVRLKQLGRAMPGLRARCGR